MVAVPLATLEKIPLNAISAAPPSASPEAVAAGSLWASQPLVLLCLRRPG